jgi:hypothetical protein
MLIAPIIALTLVGVAGPASALAPGSEHAVGSVAALAAPIPTTSKPTVTGTARVGSILTAQPGTWSSGTTFTYQWAAGGVAIAGATAKTLVLKKAQLGLTVTVTVTGAKSGYAATSRVSDPTSVVAAGVPSTPLSVVASKDDAARTATLTWAVPASDGGSAITGYRVARDGTDASGNGAWSVLTSKSVRLQTFTNLAPGATYTLTVAAVNAVGDSAKSSAVITMARGTLTVGKPTITGTPQVGVTLTSKPGTRGLRSR